MPGRPGSSWRLRRRCWGGGGGFGRFGSRVYRARGVGFRVLGCRVWGFGLRVPRALQSSTRVPLLELSNWVLISSELRP